MRKYIFIVDDESVILDSMLGIIVNTIEDNYPNQMFYYETASSVESALKKLNEIRNNSDVLLILFTDWLMNLNRNGKNGDELIKEVKKISKNTVCIMVTGMASEDTIAKLFDENLLDYVIYKPAKPTAIKDILLKSLKRIGS